MLSAWPPAPSSTNVRVGLPDWVHVPSCRRRSRREVMISGSAARTAAGAARPAGRSNASIEAIARRLAQTDTRRVIVALLPQRTRALRKFRRSFRMLRPRIGLSLLRRQGGNSLANEGSMLAHSRRRLQRPKVSKEASLMKVAGTASHRLVDATVTLLDEGGLAVAEQPVRVSQRRHAFTFGCTGFEAIPLANEELIGEDRERVAAALRPLAGALQRRDAAVLLGRVRATTWGAGHPSSAGHRSLVRRPRRGRQGPSAVLAHRDGTLAVGPDHRRDRRGPGRPDPARGRGLPRPDRHVGRDQRGRDHAGVRSVRQRHHASCS